MPIETATYVSDLDANNPLGVDGKSGGDNHLRLLKSAAKNTFPGGSKAFRFPVTSSEQTGNFSVTFPDDQNKLYIVDATAAVTVALPDPSTGGTPNEDGFDVWIVKRTGAEAVTIAASGGQTINGAASYVLRDTHQIVYLRWAKTTAKWFALGAGSLNALSGGQTTLTAPAVGDLLPIFDVSDSSIAKVITLTNMLKVLAALTAETAIALADVLLIYDDSAADVRKMTPANLLGVLNLLTEDTAPDDDADFTLTYDLSATGVKKVRLDRLQIGAVIAIIEDQKAQNTSPQSLTGDTDNIRQLNTLVFNRNTLVSLASNQFTLPAGTWEIQWWAPTGTINAVGVHQSFLYNVTDTAEVARGTVGGIDSGDTDINGDMPASEGSTVITIAASKAFEIRHRPDNTVDGGYVGNLGTEVYTRVTVRRA